MNKIIKKLLEHETLRVFAVFLFALVVFAAGFSLLEGLDFFNSLYWAVTTSSTVGYGDYSPGTIAGKILGMVVMVSGVALLGYLISTISNSLVALNMRKIMGLSRSKKSGHTIVVGWNLVAKNAIEELVAEERDLVVVDKKSHSEVTGYSNTQFILGDFNDFNTLKKAGVERASHIILAMHSDSDVILGISNIRKLNPNIVIIGRIDNLDYSEVALSAGCDRVVSPSEIGGNLIYSALREPSVVKWFMEVTTHAHGAEISELRVRDKPKLVGRKIKELGLGPRRVIVAIDKKSDTHIEVLPDPNTQLAEEDTLILVKKTKDAEHDNRHIPSDKQRNGTVLVCGWNYTMRSAVDELVKHNKKVRVLASKIEPSEKAHYEKHGVEFLIGPITRLKLLSLDLKKIHNVILGMREDARVILLAYVLKNVDQSINLIGRIDEADNNEAAYRAGLNHVVSPSEMGGQLLARALSMPSAVRFVMETTTHAYGANVVEIAVHDKKEWVGKKIKDITLPHTQLIVGLDCDSDSVVETLPDKEYVLKKNDTLVLIQK